MVTIHTRQTSINAWQVLAAAENFSFNISKCNFWQFTY